MANIVLTGGGTAGHCIPNIALIPYLKNNFENIFYIGSKNGIEKQIVSKNDIPYFSISCAKLNRSSIIKNLSIPFSLSKGIREAGKILDKIKPDIIFSKGGYVTLPVIFAAKKRKIPIISHESDFTIGLANKISAPYCKKVLTSFPETALTIKNGQFVGPPLKEQTSSKAKSLQNLGLSGKKPIIFVTGGSLGAQALNHSLRECLPYLLPNFDVLHACGKGNIEDNYSSNNYVQKEFISNMEEAYSIADVCVSRAGSNTVFEILNNKLPCLLIPLPKGASRGDQVLNAEYFQKKGMVNVLHQNVLTQKSLLSSIESTYYNRKNLIKQINSFPIENSCKKISDELVYYANLKSEN